MSGLNRRLALATLLGTTMLASPAAFAQSEPAADQASPAQAASQPAAIEYQDDIIVTAQKRDENIQDVPISIQAIGTRKLDQLNISNFNEYTQLLPSVAFQSFQPGVTTVYMRGVASGGDGNHSGSLPSVGTYLDEQPVTTIGGTLDVQSTTSRGSRVSPGRRARSMARRAKRARSASSPTSPISRASTVASTVR